MRNKTGIMEKTLKRVQGDSRCNVAFTLAELLITIGIIGVVAALTIPTLVNNYQIRSWNISSSNFEAKFGEALKIMNTQQSLSHLGTTERFVNELQKHMKVAKVCDNTKLTECFVDELFVGDEVIKSSDLKTSKNFGLEDWKTNIVGVLFANGVSGLISYNPKCSANPYDVNSVTVSGDKENITFGSDCVAMVYDTSGFANPNEDTKDIRQTSEVKKLGKNCGIEAGGKCYSKPFLPTPISVSECNELKDNLGIKACSSNSDYWAGAVKKCGGVDKMPSLGELSKFVSVFYDTTSDGGIKLNVEKVSSLGFVVRDNQIYLWANDQVSGVYSKYMDFYETSTHQSSQWGHRYTGSPRMAVCLED